MIFHLLVALAFLPVVQAMTPAVAPVQSTHAMMMDCGQSDPGHCQETDCCIAGSHTSCDANAKATPVSAQLMYQPLVQSYDPDPPERYLSHSVRHPLRPPRNA